MRVYVCVSVFAKSYSNGEREHAEQLLITGAILDIYIYVYTIFIMLYNNRERER